MVSSRALVTDWIGPSTTPNLYSQSIVQIMADHRCGEFGKRTDQCLVGYPGSTDPSLAVFKWMGAK